jgi:hypothetical protein
VQAVTAPAARPRDGRKAWAIVYLFLLAVVLSVAGLFWINHEVHVVASAEQRQAQRDARVQQAAERRQMLQQQAAALKQSKAICSALVGLDDARIGAVFASQSHTGVPLSKSYGYRLAQHLHDVVNATHCRALLAGKTRP